MNELTTRVNKTDVDVMFERLAKEFPGHKLQWRLSYVQEDFQPRYTVEFDDKKLDCSFTPDIFNDIIITMCFPEQLGIFGRGIKAEPYTPEKKQKIIDEVFGLVKKQIEKCIHHE